MTERCVRTAACACAAARAKATKNCSPCRTGTVLPCISQGDGWVKTTYNGKTGYVSQDYLLVPVTVRASTGLNLRASASETAEKLLTIPNGTVVPVLRQQGE